MDSQAEKIEIPNIIKENNNPETLDKSNLINNIENSPTNKKYKGKNTGRWDDSEHRKFLMGFLQFGNNWKKVKTFVKTRTSSQIHSHAQKYLFKLKRKYFSVDKSNLKITEENNEIENKIKESEIILNQNNILNKDSLYQLLSDLEKPECNLENIEKVIIKIFNLDKKENEDNIVISISENASINNDDKIKRIKSNIDGKRVKLKFLCKKSERDKKEENNNSEQQIDQLMNSNNQDDLRRLSDLYNERDYKNRLFLSLIKQLDSEIIE